MFLILNEHFKRVDFGVQIRSENYFLTQQIYFNQK